MVKYYYAGSQRLALRTGNSANTNLKLVLSFIKVWRVGDHASIKLSTSLGSTSVTADYAGTLISRTLYKPWGGRQRRNEARRFRVRYQSGTLPTQYTFTGQYSHTADFGLMFYNARWYDPALGRMAQADTIVPGAGNPMAWDRYAYALNSPVVYSDPTGHCPICIGALIGAAVGFVAYAANTVMTGSTFDGGNALVAAGVGAVGGALIGTGVGALAGVGMLTSIGTAGAQVLVGAGAGVIGGQVGYTLTSGSSYNSGDMIISATMGGISGAVSAVPGLGQGARMLTNAVIGATQYTATQLNNGNTPSPWGALLSGALFSGAGELGNVLGGSYHGDRLLNAINSLPQAGVQSQVAAGLKRSYMLALAGEISFTAVIDAAKSALLNTFSNMISATGETIAE